MSVRHNGELGVVLQRIVSRLMADDELVNLLYYTDKDPYSQQPLTDEQKRKEVLHKLIKVIPRVGPKETANSIIVVRVDRARNLSNSEFKNITFSIEVFVPLTQWILKNDNLRPFLILGKIQDCLNGKTINGLGRMEGGDFTLNFLTEEISCYEQIFTVTSYD